MCQLAKSPPELDQLLTTPYCSRSAGSWASPQYVAQARPSLPQAHWRCVVQQNLTDHRGSKTFRGSLEGQGHPGFALVVPE